MSNSPEFDEQTSAGAGRAQNPEPPNPAAADLSTSDSSAVDSSAADPALAAEGAAPAEGREQVQNRRQSAKTARRRARAEGSRPWWHWGILVFIVLDLVAIVVVGTRLVGALEARQSTENTYRQLAKSALSWQGYGANEWDVQAPRVDFDLLRHTNKDVQGWIYAPAAGQVTEQATEESPTSTKPVDAGLSVGPTESPRELVLNYPVVQGADNDKYRSTLFSGQANAAGTIFLDSDAQAPGGLDTQTTVFGQVTGNGQMFDWVAQAAGSAKDFARVDYFYYITPGRLYVYRPLLALPVAADFAAGRETDPAQGLEKYLDSLAQQAEKSGVLPAQARAQIGQTKQIMTLVTCEYEPAEGKRSLLVGSLVQVVDR